MSSPRIAYVLKGFPRISESFIANEVRLLGGLGLHLGLFSIKAGDKLAEDATLPPVCYLPPVTSLSNTSLIRWLQGNLPLFRLSCGYWLSRHPLRFLATLTFALRCAIRYRDASRTWLKKSFIKEFLLATEIAYEIDQCGDFVHIHAHFCHDATTVAWMTSRLTGLPFSFTAHAKDIYQRRLNPGDFLSRKLAATSFAVTCTLANVRYLRQKTSRPEKIHGIYHGLDTKRFVPRAIKSGLSSSGTVPRLLSVGRMVEKKGFTYLIDACAEVRERGYPFKLEIVGEPGDQTEIVAAKIAAQNLGDCITLLPAETQSELAERYRSAIGFVLPCVILEDGDRDGIPNVMAEAMASGLPVIVTNISGIPEIVEHEVNGLLVPPREVGLLADAIVRILDDPELGASLGRTGRRRIEAVFDASTTHKTLKVLFDDVLARAA